MRLYDFLDKTVIKENVEGLNIGDEVEITGNVQFAGATGVIDNFGKDKRFVIVNLYNHGRHSFHSSDVSFNDYADSDNEEADMYDRDEDFRRSMSNEHIAKVKGGYRLLSKHGNKNLGTYPTRAGAEKRERQVQYFKHAGESVESGVAEGTRYTGNGIHPKLVEILKQRGYKGPYQLGKLKKWFVHLKDDVNAQATDEIMVTGNDVEYDEWVLKEQYGEYAFGSEGGYMTGDANRVIKNTAPMLEQGVAEGLDDTTSATPAKNERGRFTAWDDDEPMRLKCEDGEFRTIQEINILRQKIGMKPFSIKSQQGAAEGVAETKEASDISGLLSASKLNNVFVVKTDTKSYKVKAQSARVASEKVSKAHPEAKIVSVKDVTNTK